MNNTTETQTVLGAFTYLNQSAYSLVPDGAIFSQAINYPYRLALSILSATRVQYQQAIQSNDLIFNIQSILVTVGYFFSSYAVACFITALILNRFVIMASLRSNSNRVTLPRWSRYALHLSAIIPLVYNVVQALCQVQILNVFPAVDFSFFLGRTFTVFAWSHCVETFVTTTTNLKPLEESDYTIFELSIQFYYLCQRTPNIELVKEHLSDFLMALFGRLLIHSVEMFDIRRFRLLGSTLLNFINICYLVTKIKLSGLESLPVSTRLRHFPKIFSLFLIILSIISYYLACLVRKNPFSSRKYDSKELQFYSFMHNWWNHLNCTGEEEFSSVVSKLALLLCSGTESMNKGVHREFSSLNAPNSIHHSYIISGYMNRVSTIPDDIGVGESPENTPAQKSGANTFVTRVKLSFTLIKEGFLFFFKNRFVIRERRDRSKSSKGKSKVKDYNKFVTDNNYARFLTKPSSNLAVESSIALLPEEDPSEDYVPDDFETDELDESNFDVEEFGGTITEESIGNEILNIITPMSTQNLQQDMKWLISTWSILSCAVNQNARLTRSQYSNLNPEGILSEVVLEKSIHFKPSDVEGEKVMEDNESEGDIQLACVVCRINPRNVVLWPCRCFAICEDCRISLGLRGFKSCVCCRSDVHGYSKLNAV